MSRGLIILVLFIILFSYLCKNHIIYTMKVSILNLYSNRTDDGSDFIGDHGQSFLLTTPHKKIMFDVGAKSQILLHNMKLLQISPNDIDLLVLSHGHYDHTAALPGFLDARTVDRPLDVIAHPDVREEKFAKMLFFKKPLGFPRLTPDQELKLNFIYSRESVTLDNGIKTTGEVSIRPHIDGTESLAFHQKKGKSEIDPVLDDLSIVISSDKGEIIVAGCAHAGILNICEKVKAEADKKIKCIIGGTHMVRYKPDEVKYVADELENRYDNPQLFLNHCTEEFPMPLVKKTKAIKILRDILGSEIVHHCNVGCRNSFTISSN